MVQSLLLPKQQQSRSFGSKSFLFGDNRSVVTSNTLPHSTFTKHHNILAKTATGQIMDIRQTLRYLGAPIGSKSFLHVNFLVTILLAKLPNASTQGTFIHVMDHRRLLPGGPSCSEDLQYHLKVLSSH